jgi:hypothetical protein
MDSSIIIEPKSLHSNTGSDSEITPQKRLGFYYQDCVKSILNHSHSYQVEADEVQFNYQGQTVGAIDFIVRRVDLPTQPLEHWEIAIKFYLLLDGLWYGPNARDRLDLKLEKMLSKQLTLTQHEGFAEQYPEYADLDARLLVQGRLYTNPFIDNEIPSHCAGQKLDPTAINGHWCYFDQVDQIKHPLYRVGKPDWATGKHHGQPFEATNCELHRAAHCVDESGILWFIVPNEWPNSPS